MRACMSRSGWSVLVARINSTPRRGFQQEILAFAGLAHTLVCHVRPLFLRWVTHLGDRIQRRRAECLTDIASLPIGS